MSNMKIPITNDLFSFEKKLKTIGDIQHIPVLETKILLDPERGPYVLLSTPNKQFVQPLTTADATYFSVFASEMNDDLHIPTIYNLYLDYMRECGNSVQNITIESVKGDIVYCRIVWRSKKGRLFTNVCTLGDALIIMRLTINSICIVKSALEAFEEFDNNGTYNFYDYEDYEDYEEEDEWGDEEE